LKNFLVNDDGTINVHYDRLNPSEVMSLINMLEGNANLLKAKNQSPIDVFKRSARLNRLIGEITFQFNWDGPVHRVSLNERPPIPDVSMTDEELNTYYEIFSAMTV
jgi:hypothetical protein